MATGADWPAGARGQDFSSYQPPVTAGELTGLAFAAARVSDWSANGVIGTDPDFAHNWAAFHAAGLHRMAYWYLLPSDPSSSPADQAKYFVNAVRGQGLEAGDMLVCDSEVLTSDVDAATAAFCAEVERLAGPQCPVLVYSNHDVGQHLTSCVKWPLWFAWPPTQPGQVPSSSLISPWKRWHFWQWGTVNGVDADVFDGTKSDLDAWIASHLPKPSPIMEDSMLVTLAPGQREIIPVWPHAAAAKLTGGPQSATLSLAGDTGAEVTVTVYSGTAVHVKKDYKLTSGLSVLADPGSLTNMSVIELLRTDSSAEAACTAVLSRW